MHPFDPKLALLANHAQHVVLIHFPIGLFIAAVAFDFLARWKRSHGLASAAYYNLTAAGISNGPAAFTGVLAWRWQLEGQPLKGVLLLHMLSGLLSSGLIWVVWWLHLRAHRKPEGILPVLRLPVELAAVALVAFTGHLGGFLSGVNGAG